MTSVLVDNREKPETIQRGRAHFKDLTVTTLPVGDVVCGNIVVERKKVEDFEASIKDSRYINQACNMIGASEKGAHCYILIEGSFKELCKSGYSTISREQFYGAIASLSERYMITVLMVEDNYDFWLMVEKLIAKYNDQRPIKRVVVAPNGETVTTRMLQGITGLGEVRARAIADLFTIADLALLNPDDLVKIEGIGPKYAENIIRAIREGVG